MDTGERVELGYLVGFQIESSGCPPGKVRVSGVNYTRQHISGDFDERFIHNGKLQVIITGGRVSDGACVQTSGGYFEGHTNNLSVKAHNLESHGLVPLRSITPPV